MSKNTMAVLIPTWKRPEKFRKCLEHLEKQTRAADQLYLVSRIEDSETQEIIKEFQNKLPIIAIHVERAGVIHAENAGLKRVKEDILCFLDDDAYTPPNWLENIEELLIQNPDYIGVGGPDVIFQDLHKNYRRVVDKVGNVSWYGKMIGNHHHEVIAQLDVDVLKGVNMSFWRKHVPMLDEELQSDIREGNGSHWELDICLAMSKHGKFLFSPKLELLHDSNHSHFIPNKVAINNARNYTYVILKHFGLFQRIAFLIYLLAIGNTNAFGILKCFVELVKKRRPSVLRIYALNLLGILKGIRTFLVSSR